MNGLHKFFSTHPSAYYAGLTVTSLAIVILFVFVLWPFVLGQAVRFALAQPGMRDVQVERVTFNPLNAQLRVRELRIQTPRQEVLRAKSIAVDLDYLALWHRRIHIEDATLQDISIQAVEQGTSGATEIAGFALSQSPGDRTAESEPSKWRFGVSQLDIQNATIVYAQPDRDTPLRIVHLALQNLAQWESDEAAQLRLSLEVSDGEFAAQGNFQPFERAPNASFDLQLADVHLRPLLQFAVPQETARIEGALSAALKLVFDGKQDAAPLITVEGMLELAGIDGEIAMTPAPQFKIATIGWRGDVRLSLDAEAPRFSLDGEVSATGLRATRDNTAVEQEMFSWRGTVESAPDGDRAVLPFSVAGDIAAHGITLSDATLGRARIGDIKVTEWQLDSAQTLSAAALSVAGIEFNPAAQAPPAEDAFLAVGQMTVETIGMPAPDRLEIGKVRMSDVAATMVRNADGMLNSVALINQTDAAPADSQTVQVEKAATRPFGVKIGELTVEGKSQVRFEDHAVSPTVGVVAENISLQLGAIDTAAPDAQTPFTLKMDFRDFGMVSARGHAMPFAATPKGDIALQVSTLELPVISPYTRRYLGYAVRRGRLDATLDATIAGGQLSADSELKLTKLKMEVADQDKAAPLQAQIDLPINAALSLLRDSDDIITLSLPISGPLDSPQVGFGQVINKALGKALKATVATTLTALFPVTGVLVVANLAGTPKLKFNPVTFDPGRDELNSAQTAYLDEVAALLKARPAVELTLCGRVTEADREALAGQDAREGEKASQAGEESVAEPSVADAVLLQLGDRRVNRVKRYLVDQHPLAPARLFECKSEIDTSADARPHVEVLM